MTLSPELRRGNLGHVILDLERQGDSRLESNVRSLRLYLHGQEPGTGAEVQVAVVDGSLVIIATGHVLMDRDTRGFARVRVEPE